MYLQKTVTIRTQSVPASSQVFYTHVVDPAVDLGSAPATMSVTATLYAAKLDTHDWTTFKVNILTSTERSGETASWEQAGSSIDLSSTAVAGEPGRGSILLSRIKSSPDTLYRYYRWQLEGDHDSTGVDPALICLKITFADASGDQD